MARTYKTISLSVPPGVFEELAAIGKTTGRTGARVATEIVLRELARTPATTRQDTRRASWCCQAVVRPVTGQLVLPEVDGDRSWVPVVVLLCAACGSQMHGREYEGWITDA